MYALASRLPIATLFLSPMMTLTSTARDHELLYVGNNHSGTISVISVPEFEVLGEFDGLPDLAERQTFRTPAQVDDLVAPESGEVLYVSRPKTRDIAAFSTETEELLWRLPTPGKPDHFAITPDGSSPAWTEITATPAPVWGIPCPLSPLRIERRSSAFPSGDYPQRMWTTRVTFRRVSR